MHFPHIPHFHFGLPPHIFHNLVGVAIVCGIAYLLYRLLTKRSD